MPEPTGIFSRASTLPCETSTSPRVMSRAEV